MKAPVKFRPDRGKWELTIYRDGKRKRTQYETEAEALAVWKSHCRQLERFGSQGNAISGEEGREFLEAKRIAGGEDLRDIARFWRVHNPEDAQAATVGEAWRAFYDEKAAQGLSARHLQSLRYHVGNFSTCWEERQVREVKGSDVRAYLLELGLDARTLANIRGGLSNFFNWCLRRELVSVNPMDKVHDADLPAVRPKAKGILTVDQCAALMAWVDENAPKLAPWHALQLFAGIRRAEVPRLHWDWLDFEKRTITLPGWESGERVVKTGDDWVLHDLPSNLWAWLEKHRGTGRIYAPAPEVIAELRAVEFPKIGIATWPKNAMRHTFCTMMMSLHGDAAKVANWSRHTNAAQLYRSYVAKLVSRKEAERFTAILPAGFCQK